MHYLKSNKGTLLAIHDESMNSFVAKKIGECYFGSCDYWTGGYKTTENYGVSSWRWWSDETKESMSYTSWDWLAGQPDGKGIEERITTDENGKWHDRSGNEEHKFICTKKASTGTVFIEKFKNHDYF